jgi:hypothetical protein
MVPPTGGSHDGLVHVVRSVIPLVDQVELHRLEYFLVAESHSLPRRFPCLALVAVPVLTVGGRLVQPMTTRWSRTTGRRRSERRRYLSTHFTTEEIQYG